MKKIVFSVFAILMVVLLSACGEPSGSRQDIYTTQENANNIQENQPTPTDSGRRLYPYPARLSDPLAISSCSQKAAA